MKNYFLIALISLFLVACSKNDDNSNCNFLLNAGVNYSLNLNLPQFSDLQFTSNSVYVPNQGNGGIIITNNGTGIVAWDASDPNHAPSTCSIMTISGGINAKCNCSDGNEYSLITGQSLNDPLPCTLKFYRVEPTGNNTYYISN
jgi:nitrite reductase/ring-hydroxylating ferredoxin subunit